MKLSIIAASLFALTLSGYSALAQVHENLMPRSFAISSQSLATLAPVVFSFDTAAAASLDRRDDKLGHMPRFARAMAADLSLTNSGTWTSLPNGDRIWRCQISAVGAQGLIPSFDAFYIPRGAMVHVYTPGKDEVIGAFTSENNPANGTYNTGLIHGDACIVEYYEPAAIAGTGRLHVNQVGYAYRMVPGSKASRDFGQSNSCEVNVVCPEGRLWQDQKHAVVRILVKLGADYGWCSGTLMNNTSQDCTPYILSADHCYQDESNSFTAATTADLNQWVFYFNYESPTCADPAVEGRLGTHFIVGCAVTAASLDNGGNNGSDFVLVRANTSVPLSFNPYYAGWNNGSVASNAGVGIHHPNGDIKKISTYSTALSSATWNHVPGTHWQVQWAPTLTGSGVTEPGSSGSPIFDLNHRVVGTLTGGLSECNQTTLNDLYGKLAYDWSSNGVTATKRLRDWLDPGNTGVTVFDGQYAPCVPSLTYDLAIRSIQQSGPVCDQSVALTATLVNYGSQQVSQDSVTFVIDGGTPQSFVWSGSLDPQTSIPVSLPPQTIPGGTHTLTVISSAPDGNPDANTANDTATSTFTVYSDAAHYTFTLQTSDRGEDVSWQLLDANNIAAYSGGPYTATNQTITQSWCLAQGCYTFTIFNSASLGLKGTITDGTYDIQDDNGSSVASLRNVLFGAKEVTSNICSTATGIHDQAPALSDVSIYPNPSSGVYMLTNTSEVTSLTVTDALGRLIMKSDMHGASTAQVDLSANESGVYFFRLASDQGNITKKVILNTGK